MKRLPITVSLVCSFILVCGSSARAQDMIHYFDRKKQANEVGKGTITEESPAEVT